MDFSLKNSYRFNDIVNKNDIDKKKDKINFKNSLNYKINNYYNYINNTGKNNNDDHKNLISVGLDITNNKSSNYSNNYHRIITIGGNNNISDNINIFNNKINKIYQNPTINGKEKTNRQIEYSDRLRNQIGENIKGARHLKNRNNINLNIIKHNFNKRNINNNRYFSPNYYYTDNSKENSINNSLLKRYNNNNNSHSIQLNNLKFNIFNSIGESIFKKEEYSNMIRKSNGERYKIQREKKYEDFFNTVYNNAKNFDKIIDSNNNREFNNDNDNILKEILENKEKDEKIVGNIDDDSEEKSKITKKNEESEYSSEVIRFTDNEESNEKADNEEEDEDEDNNETGEIDDDVLYENPIDDEIIENLPITKLNDIEKLSDEDKKCTICLENFNKNDNIIHLPCIHFFHEVCIKNWFQRQNFCPICRFKITSENINEANI